MYNVHSANYGKYGITIIEYPSRALMKKQGTGIPGVRGDIRWIPSFYDNRDQLPEDKVEIVWQLNELTNCERPIEGKSRNSEYPGTYTRKFYCTWTPLPNKIFRKTIDIQALKKSEHFKRSGDNADGFSLIPRFARKRIMDITLVFRDEEMDVNLSSFITNPWK